MPQSRVARKQSQTNKNNFIPADQIKQAQIISLIQSVKISSNNR
jgi:hypothetical protein